MAVSAGWPLKAFFNHKQRVQSFFGTNPENVEERSQSCYGARLMGLVRDEADFSADSMNSENDQVESHRAQS